MQLLELRDGEPPLICGVKESWFVSKFFLNARTPHSWP
jgi:hypothetical protein